MSRLTIAALLLAAIPAISAEDEKEHPILARVRKAKVTGPFALVVTLQVKKGQEKAFLDAVKPCVAASVKEKGCIAYELSRDLEDATRFVIYEKWKSPEALALHLEAAHFKKLADSLAGVLNGAPEVRVCKLDE